MHKKTKIFILLFFILISNLFFHTSFSKYVIESTDIIAKIDIDRCPPNIELLDAISSNTDYPTYANQTHLITVHLKLTEKNIIRNDLSSSTIKIAVGNRYSIKDTDIIDVDFKNFSLISENATEKVYEFSFTHTIGNGSLAIIVPAGLVEDKSGLINDKKILIAEIAIDNTPPRITFEEIVNSDGTSKAQLRLNEPVRPINGWDMAPSRLRLTKDFPTPISYALPVTDWAQNTAEAFIDIKNATSILLEYGTYDAYSSQTLVTSGKISSPNTISTNSICKTEALILRLSGNIAPDSLQGRAYVHTYWGEGARAVCLFSELPYYHGYNPSASNSWWNIGSNNLLVFNQNIFSQFGGHGINRAGQTALYSPLVLPNDIASQYLYGISSIQFRLQNNSEYSIVYQCYVNGIGWLKASFDGEENCYQLDKPISSLRMNLVPKSEKQYLIDFWNRDVGTNHIN